MNPALTWLIKAVLAHLITDFVLQPTSWIQHRKKYHFASVKLYMHGILTGLVAWIFLGNQYLIVEAIILVTHTLIDGWKSYRKDSVNYFLADQFLHLAIIAGCWIYVFHNSEIWQTWASQLQTNTKLWPIATAVVFLTTPAGITIGKLTSKWRDAIEGAESLANAGKWIGIIERLIVFVLVLQSQYSAIGLLVAAKGIIRFSEKDRQETKTEYLVIGTLLSIGTAMLAGLLATLAIM